MARTKQTARRSCGLKSNSNPTKASPAKEQLTVSMKSTKDDKEQVVMKPGLRKLDGRKAWLKKFVLGTKKDDQMNKKLSEITGHIAKTCNTTFGQSFQPVFLSRNLLENLRKLYVMHSRMEQYDIVSDPNSSINSSQKQQVLTLSFRKNTMNLTARN